MKYKLYSWYIYLISNTRMVIFTNIYFYVMCEGYLYTPYLQNWIFKLANKLFCVLRAFLQKWYYYIIVLLSYEEITSRHMIGILSYNDMSLLPESIKKISS